MYGTQTALSAAVSIMLFENDVKMYGTQTTPQDNDEEQVFENDVKMYGTQTATIRAERLWIV